MDREPNCDNARSIDFIPFGLFSCVFMQFFSCVSIHFCRAFLYITKMRFHRQLSLMRFHCHQFSDAEPAAQPQTVCDLDLQCTSPTLMCDEAVVFRRVGQCEWNRRQSAGTVATIKQKKLKIRLAYKLFTFCMS